MQIAALTLLLLLIILCLQFMRTYLPCASLVLCDIPCRRRSARLFRVPVFLRPAVQRQECYSDRKSLVSAPWSFRERQLYVRGWTFHDVGVFLFVYVLFSAKIL